MKKTILTTVLILTMLFIVSTVSYAQGHPSSWYGAMAYAYRAEQAVKANEQKVTANKNKTIVTNLSVAEVKKDYISTSEKTDNDEKKR
jgi:hypothetical protein